MFMYITEDYFNKVIRDEIYNKKKSAILIFMESESKSELADEFRNQLERRLLAMDKDRKPYPTQIYVCKKETAGELINEYNIDKEVTILLFSKGNIVKYISQSGYKDGCAINDMATALLSFLNTNLI